MKINKMTLAIVISVFAIIGVIGFQKYKSVIAAKHMHAAMGAPVAVETDDVTQEDIYTVSESAGRIEAKYSVDVVARINGWLEKRYFTEGANVKKGQTLFSIESNEYKIAIQQASAATRQAQASLVNSEKELARAAELVKNDYVSKSYYDNALAARDQNKATYDMRKAELANAERNLNYTNIVSPIDGKIGKIFITEGNLVNTQTGKLATIVSSDPIYAYYNLKSHDYIKFKKEDSHNYKMSNVKIELKLADGSIYPILGTVEFVDNVVDPTAGTIAMRASFANPNNILVPGDYVTVLSSLKTPKTYTLVSQKAVLKSAEGSYVYTIDMEGKSQITPIVTGIQVGDKWEVLSGLKKGDKVIVSGLTSIRPGILVTVTSGQEKEAPDCKENEKENKENKE